MKSDRFKRSKSDKDGKSDTLEPMDVKVIFNAETSKSAIETEVDNKVLSENRARSRTDVTVETNVEERRDAEARRTRSRFRCWLASRQPCSLPCSSGIL